ncbi:hypothetical protein P170DRAFT_283516 [Aspergillus steynii IBT 23096]|uniref:Uncharacterized protein n=1 Tax=Aspergillus steynii IBT 23096 TaxID=1392250 RepID=A0A2I2FUQ9_9EURO|nr:uncharacterized protein P170DRAFT_283516 [Aspergillus steynii IBT 23096]PLB44341.1 hypothetical protein P170DRAFT_283516 [Aspergillus steynii IBT 23096]
MSGLILERPFDRSTRLELQLTPLFFFLACCPLPVPLSVLLWLASFFPLALRLSWSGSSAPGSEDLPMVTGWILSPSSTYPPAFPCQLERLFFHFSPCSLCRTATAPQLLALPPAHRTVVSLAIFCWAYLPTTRYISTLDFSFLPRNRVSAPPSSAAVLFISLLCFSVLPLRL